VKSRNGVNERQLLVRLRSNVGRQLRLRKEENGRRKKKRES